jgi:hypothetical protein
MLMIELVVEMKKYVPVILSRSLVTQREAENEMNIPTGRFYGSHNCGGDLLVRARKRTVPKLG